MPVKSDVSATARPLVDLLDDAVERHGERVVIRMDSEQWTYRQLGELVDRCAANLAGHGVGAGARIALSAGNGPAFVAVVFAAARLGASIIMVSTAWRDSEVRHALALTEPTHVVHDRSGATRLDELVTDRPVLLLSDVQRDRRTVGRSRARRWTSTTSR